MKHVLMTAAAAVLALASAASATTFTFSDGGGNGSGFQDPLPAPDDFYLTLTGNDNGSGGITTTFTAVAGGTSETISFDWEYTSFDDDGSSWDPFGYFVGGNFTQLSDNGVYNDSGTVSFTVNAGESYGFYVVSVDGIYGAGYAQVQGIVSPIPLPAGGLLLVGALGGLAMVRRRKTTGQ